MSEVINGYNLMAPLHNNNAGFSCWTFASKDEKEYFLKQFLNPAYPTDETLSKELRDTLLRICGEYETKMRSYYNAINDASDGNLVRIKEFFRCDSRYYITTERVVGKRINPEELQNYPYVKRLQLCKAVAHAIMGLHAAHIVHSDIKWDNVIIRETATGNLTGKIIDFDDGFFETEPPTDGEELRCDQVYVSPEGFMFMFGENARLSCKMDVFALGVLFHQYLAGKLPQFDDVNYESVCDALLDDAPVTLDESLPPKIRTLISKMIEVDPDKRISAQKVYEALAGPAPAPKKPEVEPVKTTTTTTRMYKNPKDAFKPAKDR